MDAQLSQLEMAKKEVEQKLSSIGSTLRRVAGIQMDGSVNVPFKLMSPSRRWSPARSMYIVNELHGVDDFLLMCIHVCTRYHDS